MDILTFAHRGEAKSFLKDLRPVNFAFEGLYQNEEIYLLITGEGIQRASEKLAATLGAFKEIDRVLNFGVCGALDRKFKEGEILKIRTCYLEKNNKMEFKSFSTDDLGEIDCISAHERVLNEDYAKYLSYFAPLVDREAWAIGSVSSLFSKPFFSYKYVSDFAKGEICQVVADNAENISNALFGYYKKLKLVGVTQNKEIGLRDCFHFTTSQKRLFNSLQRKLKIKGIALNEVIDLKAIENLPVSPKQKAALTIETLEKVLFPFNEKIKRDIGEIIKPTSEKGIKINFSKNFETDEIELKHVIKNQKDMENAISALKLFPLKDIQEILSGRADV